MNAGLHEWPLILFTVFSQYVVGSFLLFGIALRQTQDIKSYKYIHKSMFILLFLLGIGFLFSILHLGSPLRAFNSLNRVGQSMLSNEIASGIIFFSVAGLYWICAITNKIPQIIGRIWMAIIILLGFIFIYMMASVYYINTVPTWHSINTFLMFYLTVISGGLTLGYTLLKVNHYKEYDFVYVPYFFLANIIFIAIVTIYQAIQIGMIHSAIQDAITLVPDYVSLIIVRLLCLGISALILLRSHKILLLILATLLTLCGELIGRTIFYGLHMTVGVAIGG